ncbi:MAG TPA: SurA N-terminal domain-containing protein [Longimicrobiaceae bacterium]|nr:SurA N-terminal domain-containing protein [Longimicrobiaceae bacterium]
MMQLIRSNAGKFLVIPIIVAFIAWMVVEIGMDITGVGSGGYRQGELGRVNDQPITAQAYQAAYDQMYQRLQQQTGGQVTPEQVRMLREQVWEELVNDVLMRQEMARRGIGVSDAEIRFAARNVPYPPIANEEIFLTNGQFDLNKYHSFLAGPTVDANLLNEIEQYFRNAIPQSKLVRELNAGLWVSDAELWRAWQDQNETATVEYVALDLSRLAPAEPQVSDAEVRAHYREHQEEFDREESARFTVAYLPKTLTRADSLWTLQRAQQLRAEIVGGADFGEVAERESSDEVSARQGGDLGEFRKGQFVPEFDAAAFSLPVGEVSEPVLSQFGYHLIKVESRTDSTARARHVLIPIQKSDADLTRLDAKADSLEELAQRPGTGLDRAARLVGATVRRGVTVSDGVAFIPGVGSGIEALEWASGEATARDAPARPISEVMETDQAMYLVQLESYHPKGRMTLREATPQIRRELILQKKREAAKVEGRKLVAAVRGGQTLAQAAAARGLQVQTAGPFTRVAQNPIFGQANAAIGAAFGTPVGRVSDVVETPAGLFIIRPTARTQADRRGWEAQKESQRQATTFQLQQEAYQRWMASVRAEAEIVDNRDQAFSGA